MTQRHHLLSKSLEEELASQSLAVTKGNIPSWLNGTLIRNGPSKFEANGKRVPHWFDGLSMLHAFSFHNGYVTYTNRFLRSEAYEKVFKEGSINFLGFATDPCSSLFKRLFSLFFPSKIHPIHNANVNVAKFFDQYVALTETPLPVQFDAQTLRTAGVFDYQDTLPHHNCWESAHPHPDIHQESIINYIVAFGRKTSYLLYSMSKNSKSRKIFATLPVERPSYMHTFSLTPHYAILTAYPLVVDPKAPILSGRGFIKNYKWQPERGTSFIVVDRTTGDTVLSTQTSPFFAFHHVNAYEEKNAIIIDIVSYADAAIVEALADYGNNQTLPCPSLIRYHIDLLTGKVSQKVIADIPLELPRINSLYDGQHYQFAYGCDLRESPTDAGRSLYKVDVSSGKIESWSEEGCYPGEAVFVPSPSSKKQMEDDGVILSVVLNDFAEKSFLLVLDAHTWTEIGRAEVPHPIPMGLHGQYF